MRVPPTHTHTHTQTLGIHVRLSAPGFGAHRICTCADPDFHFFSSAYFTEGPICLGPLPVSFCLTENYRINLYSSPCERPTHDAQKSVLKVVVILVEYVLVSLRLSLVRYGFVEVLGCFHGPSCIVLKMLQVFMRVSGGGAGVSGSP